MGANTDVYHSCSASLNGEMFLFGGYDSFTKQISKINGCSLELIGQLPFDFERGACGTILIPEPRIMLCFGRTYKRKCTRLVHDKKMTDSGSETVICNILNILKL